MGVELASSSPGPIQSTDPLSDIFLVVVSTPLVFSSFFSCCYLLWWCRRRRGENKRRFWLQKKELHHRFIFIHHLESKPNSNYYYYTTRYLLHKQIRNLNVWRARDPGPDIWRQSSDGTFQVDASLWAKCGLHVNHVLPRDPSSVESKYRHRRPILGWVVLLRALRFPPQNFLKRKEKEQKQKAKVQFFWAKQK